MSIGLGSVIIGLIVLVVAIAIAWFLLSRLYARSSTEVSFVRTGFLGQKVVINGGAVVIPVMHQVIRVNMNTIRLEVRRENERALITKDRMRANVEADFYMRIEANKQAVALAAQTLGARTLSPDGLQELIQGKLVDALRAVAAEMTMEELHQERQLFASQVRDILAEALSKNGLTIETASIVQLDQTSREFFNPNNAFDAAGLTKLTEQIEERRKRRNEIEQDTQVALQFKNLQSERQLLDIGREQEYARLGQEKEIAMRRAQQGSEVATERAARQIDSEQADIAAKEALDLARIAAERRVAEERVALEQRIRELEVTRSRAVEIAEIERRKTIEIAEQTAAIEVAEQEATRAKAQVEAELARAGMVKAEEEVISARDIVRAERERRIQVIAAATESERQSLAKRGVADTDRYVAGVEAEAMQIRADGETAVAKLQTSAAELRYAIDAAGRRALNEADNVQSAAVINLRLKLSIIEHLAGIIHESVKPMERIESIKVLQVDGLTGGASASDGASGGGSIPDQLVNSALRFRSQAPIVDALLREIGLTSNEIGSVGKLLGNKALISDEAPASPLPQD